MGLKQVSGPETIWDDSKPENAKETFCLEYLDGFEPNDNFSKGDVDYEVTGKIITQTETIDGVTSVVTIDLGSQEDTYTIHLSGNEDSDLDGVTMYSGVANMLKIFSSDFSDYRKFIAGLEYDKNRDTLKGDIAKNLSRLND